MPCGLNEPAHCPTYSRGASQTTAARQRAPQQRVHIGGFREEGDPNMVPQIVGS